MSATKPSKLPAFFNADFTNENSILLANTYALRKTVGILGMLMPFLLYFYVFFDVDLKEPLESLSHYYYTRASGVFTAVLSILAIFLIIYKGNEPIDCIMSVFAGIGALLVAFCPTDNITTCCDFDKKYSVTYLEPNAFREDFHLIIAAVFLLCLAFMSIFLFTKSNKPKAERGPEKILRNRIYRVCGVLMILALLTIFFGGVQGMLPKDFYVGNSLTFWLETLAIECFGFSWLVKGRALFRDKA